MLDHRCQVQRHSLAEQFVAHAMALRRYVLDEHPPARIHVFRLRLPMMHRENYDGPKANSGMAFAWYIWERGHSGPTAIDRISW